MMKHIVIAILIFLPAILCHSQNDEIIEFSSDVNNFLLSTYNFQFQEADSLLAIIKSEESKYIASLCEINQSWWYIITGNNTDYYKELALAKLDTLIYEIQSRDDEFERNELIFLASSFLTYKFRISMMAGDRVGALAAIHKMGSYIHVMINKYDEYPLFKLPVAIYHYSVEKALAQYPFLKVGLIFYPKADIETGKQFLLDNLNSDNILLRTESAYFLMRFNYDIQLNHELAALYADQLTKSFPKNLVYQYFQLLILKDEVTGRKNYQEERLHFINKIKENKQLNQLQQTHFLNLIITKKS